MVIRKATLQDVPGIMNILRETILEMHSYGNQQWDENYPQESDFLSDIERGELYIAKRDGNLAGVICINNIEPFEYKELPWSLESSALVIHRMAVSLAYRKQNVGLELVAYAEKLASQLGINYVKTDTYSLNIKAQNLFQKNDYKFVSTMRFLGKKEPFFCYEKVLAHVNHTK